MSSLRAPWMLLGTTLLMPLLIAACSSDSDNGDAETGAGTAATEGYALKQTFDTSIELTSPVFNRVRRIPLKHACVTKESYNKRLGKTLYGEDKSPPLEWSGVPEGTRSLVLIMDSDENPGKRWVHWILWGIPSDATSLPEGVPNRPEAPSVGLSTRQGVNDRKETGYSGPCPRGTEQFNKGGGRYIMMGRVLYDYHFHLYALDTELDLGPETTKDDLLRAMDGHILSAGHLKGEINAMVKRL